MRDLLDSLVRALLGDSMPDRIDVSRRAGQTVGPPDRGGIENDVVLGTVVEGGAVVTHGLSVDGG
ncbi:hypothetical protein N9135_01925, partial [Akkermansiaceae bacterium]|nr:hypothetical protein [Akkermansiaceae bacterium]